MDIPPSAEEEIIYVCDNCGAEQDLGKDACLDTDECHTCFCSRGWSTLAEIELRMANYHRRYIKKKIPMKSL